MIGSAFARLGRPRLLAQARGQFSVVHGERHRSLGTTSARGYVHRSERRTGEVEASGRISTPLEGIDLSLNRKMDRVLPEQEVIRTIHDPKTGVTIDILPTYIKLTAELSDTRLESVALSYVWLRDVCQDPTSKEPASKQKLFHTSDIAFAADDQLILHDSIQLVPSATDSPLPDLQLAFSPQYPVVNAFSATFSSAPPPTGKPHVTRIPMAQLLQHISEDAYAASHFDIGGTPVPWSAREMATFPPSGPPPPTAAAVERIEGMTDEERAERPIRMPWGKLLPKQDGAASDDVITSLKSSDSARYTLINGLLRDGLAFVTGVPTDKTGDAVNVDDPQAPHLARLAGMLGEIRHTFYGSLWNVRSLGSATRNIAYTNLDLGLHMDLCYFQNPPRFQFLHMLRNRVQGGQSIFVDAMAVAEEMWQQHRSKWEILAKTPVCFEYQNDGRHYRYTHPTFELAQPAGGHAGPADWQGQMPRLTAINYSPPFQGDVPIRFFNKKGDTSEASLQRERDFYDALSTFAKLTHEERFRYERMLQEGECVVFDNRRVLHARRGFEWDAREGEGGEEVKRWLKGCYVDGDPIWSQYRYLHAKAIAGR